MPNVPAVVTFNRFYLSVWPQNFIVLRFLYFRAVKLGSGVDEIIEIDRNTGNVPLIFHPISIFVYFLEQNN